MKLVESPCGRSRTRDPRSRSAGAPNPSAQLLPIWTGSHCSHRRTACQPSGWTHAGSPRVCCSLGIATAVPFHRRPRRPFVSALPVYVLGCVASHYDKAPQALAHKQARKTLSFYSAHHSPRSAQHAPLDWLTAATQRARARISEALALRPQRRCW